MSQFDAANAHVVGVSADPVGKLEDFTKKNTIKHQILSDFGRTMLPAYGVMVTDTKSPMYRLAKRAYFILDRQGIVRFARVQANPLDLLKTEDVLKALKGLGVNGVMSDLTLHRLSRLSAQGRRARAFSDRPHPRG